MVAASELEAEMGSFWDMILAIKGHEGPRGLGAPFRIWSPSQGVRMVRGRSGSRFGVQSLSQGVWAVRTCLGLLCLVGKAFGDGGWGISGCNRIHSRLRPQELGRTTDLSNLRWRRENIQARLLVETVDGLEVVREATAGGWNAPKKL